MRHVADIAIAAVVTGALAGVLTFNVISPGHAGEAQVLAVAEKLGADKFEKKLQDTRDGIGKDRKAPPAGDASGSGQIVVDICKKNPQLPQCAL